MKMLYEKAWHTEYHCVQSRSHYNIYTNVTLYILQKDPDNDTFLWSQIKVKLGEIQTNMNHQRDASLSNGHIESIKQTLFTYHSSSHVCTERACLYVRDFRCGVYHRKPKEQAKIPPKIYYLLGASLILQPSKDQVWHSIILQRSTHVFCVKKAS